MTVSDALKNYLVYNIFNQCSLKLMDYEHADQCTQSPLKTTSPSAAVAMNDAAVREKDLKCDSGCGEEEDLSFTVTWETLRG